MGNLGAEDEGTQEGEQASSRRGESVEQTVRQIREGIVTGRFALGQRLIVRELMDELGWSRSTLREAFGQLAAEGLLDLIPNRGATVRRLSRREMRDLFQIRESLEGLAARLAALHIDQGDNRQRMEALWERVRESTAMSSKDFRELNQHVHETILAMGGNEQLERLLGRIQLPLVMIQVNQALGSSQIAQSCREHVDIVQAILSGKPDAADAAMRRHLHRSGEWTLGLAGVFRPE
jgi:DNA-binding GntR family transcriptional regulator